MNFNFTSHPICKLFAVMLLLTASGCSLEKKSAVNRGLQNLTAHYNILFNARETLRERQETYDAGFVDDYSELLSVYQDTAAQPPGEDKELEATKQRARTIISIKEQSHYIPDAYFVLGKASYYGSNFFDAVEYFNYAVSIATAKQAGLKQDAMIWKARSLMYLKKMAEAKNVIDTAMLNINPKKHNAADVYATKLQYDINTGDYADGEEMAKLAIADCKENLQRMRWTFILGQLQELNHKPTEAISNYDRVARSNVSFDMAFNANLNRIRIADAQSGVRVSRINRLRSLLRNPNNADFTDQIYYQIGQLQYADNNIDDAIKSYKQSTARSTRNLSQKGLTYLRLADVYFKNKSDYTLAKNYYDSSLVNLSPNYPGYAAIAKKADNLQFLADKLQIISKEDTLQMLAAMDEASRNKRIDEMVNRQTLQQQTVAGPGVTANGVINAADPFNTNPTSPQASTPTGTNFYFYNANAISQGFTDFKRVWGNRKLEDNWRRSNRSNADLTINTLNTTKNTDPDAVQPTVQRTPGQVDAASYRQDIVQNLPLTPALLAQSNQHRYDAYLDIANFYRDVLDDRKEAEDAYERILTLFPNNPNKAAIYYNLYRLYNEGDTPLSDKYRNLVLKDYPETPYAKTILDPDYGKRLNDEDTGFSTIYNKVYDLYAAKKYAETITAVDGILQQYPNNRYAAQLAYLRALAGGHRERLAPFATDLQQIAAKYPDDKLITPLVNQHLSYINVNQAELAARPIVITDRDLTEGQFSIPIVYQQQTEYRAPNTYGPYIPPVDTRKPEKKPEPAPVVAKAEPIVEKKEPVVTAPVTQPEVKRDTIPPPVAQQTVKQPEITLDQPAQQPVKIQTNSGAKAPSIFNLKDSTNYYFVVSVSSGTTNLASSRFGIGQFNRVQYQGPAISHQLKNAGADHQLIYVGRFASLNAAKEYARGIVPLLPDIMKVPKDKYSFFIITRENLNKLADAKTLDSYIDYYQQTY